MSPLPIGAAISRRLGTLRPSRAPVRWRLALVSSGLTMVILITFAVVVGRLTVHRLVSDFRGELVKTATDFGLHYDPDQYGELSMPGAAGLRIIGADGVVYRGTSTPGAPDVGPPLAGVDRVGDFQVAVAPVQATMDSTRMPALFVQATRRRDDLERTIDRLWLFLGCGVFFGTLFAAIAGMAVARRAMRPIASLNAAAREIASTRDTSRRIPIPPSDDEVAELARTLDEMLRQLDAAQSETAISMQRQREFIADASHELRTPLTSVLANLELIEADNSTEREAIASALRSSRRMGRLVTDLLILARADAGRLSSRARIDLGSLIVEAVLDIRPIDRRHRIELAEMPPTEVEGNHDELTRMVINLLQNALQHTPSGTAIEVRLWHRDSLAVIEISDDGPGIPVGAYDQVFERFTRGPGPADLAVRSGEGTGLGLAIVRAVAEAHGGEVRCSASESGGACFTVTLPRRTSPQFGEIRQGLVGQS